MKNSINHRARNGPFRAVTAVLMALFAVCALFVFVNIDQAAITINDSTITTPADQLVAINNNTACTTITEDCFGTWLATADTHVANAIIDSVTMATITTAVKSSTTTATISATGLIIDNHALATTEGVCFGTELATAEFCFGTALGTG